MRVIDVHIHPIRRILNPEKLVGKMDKLGIEKAVLLAVDIGPSYVYNGYLEERIYRAFKYTNITNIPKLIYEAREFLEFANTPNYVLEEYIDKYPHRFIAFGSISPLRKTAEIKREFNYLIEKGFRGIKTIPTLQFYDPKKNDNIRFLWSLAERERFIVLAHTGFDPGPWEYFPLSIYARPSRYIKLIKEFETPVILAHAGSYSAYHPGIWHSECVELVKKYDHVYMDISAAFYLVNKEKVVETWRRESIIDKILFGSDFPAIDGLGLEESINIVKNSKILSNREKLKILYENAKKLLK